MYQSGIDFKCPCSNRPFLALARYEILPLPAHLHPVLVFVNGRSGNQDGTNIARRLRRVLHPLQVRNWGKRRRNG
jgi:hypothetical protein